MDWEAIGAVGELLGALGVLLTLIYLAIQVRNSAEETHNSTIESVMSSDANHRHALINGPIPSIMTKLQTAESLTAEETLELTYYLQSYMQGWEVAFYLNTRGTLPDDVLQAIAFRRMAAMLLTNEVVPWSSFSAGYTTAFQNHVASCYAEFEVAEKPWEVKNATV